MILFGVRSGRMDGVNSDNRATSAQVQMNLPTRAELGKKIKLEELKAKGPLSTYFL